MNRPSQHPDSELLDRLRAGLLDEYPARKDELMHHLQDCDLCRGRYHWPAHLQSHDSRSSIPEVLLDEARRRALNTPRRNPLRRFIPAAAVAAIALVTVVVLYPLQNGEQSTPHLVRAETQEIPEVYEDLDFYLWLSDHTQERDSAT